jgi:hypothetical protein
VQAEQEPTMTEAERLREQLTTVQVQLAHTESLLQEAQLARSKANAESESRIATFELSLSNQMTEQDKAR